METVRRTVLGVRLCLHYVVLAVENALQCNDPLFQSSEVVTIFTMLSFLIIGVILYINFYDGDE